MESFGWLPDCPDLRDYTRSHKDILPLLGAPKPAPPLVDLRPYCPPVVDQGSLGSCTANAAAGLLGYFQKRSFGKTDSASRLFIYKATRNLMRAHGDTGAYIRTTMGSLALFGAPPEKYWGYNPASLDLEPPAFCYSFAQNYQALKYFRLDEALKAPSETLSNIRGTLSQGLPAMFGFSVYNSIRSVGADGRIPFPSPGESLLGGHAVLAVGYDDSLKIGSSTGAFIIRNSWGETWGNHGYGYLPYDYLLKELAMDWWALVKAEWVDTTAFGV